MKITKLLIYVIFIASVFLYNTSGEFTSWVTLVFCYLVVSLINLKDKFEDALPFGEVISLIFFIENVLAVVIMNLINHYSLTYIDEYYMDIPLYDYLPFAFLSSQSILLGFNAVKKTPRAWINYMNGLHSRINKDNLLDILKIGVAGAVINVLHLPINGYISFLLSNFIMCSLIGFYLIGEGDGKKGNSNYTYLLAGLGINLVSSINGGMFTTLTTYFLFFGLIIFTRRSASGKKINVFFFIPAIIFGVVFLAFLQNFKGAYRKKSWAPGSESSSSTFFSTAGEIYSNTDILSPDYYHSILGRLNQGWLVSCTMHKVPRSEDFANGETIITDFTDALLPRFINPNKQVVGNSKIKRFTYLILQEGTAMSIGVLGETYVNFGITGGIIFIFLFGYFLSYLEKSMLLYANKNPLIVLFFPILMTLFLSSGTDFFQIFNSLTMGLIFVFIILSYIKPPPNLNLKKQLI